MLDERIVDIVSRQHGVVARGQLRAAGLSSTGIGHRVRRHRLFPVLHGVFALGPHIDVWGLRQAAVLSAGGASLEAGSANIARIRVALSHWSVLHLHGLIDAPPDQFHVTIEGTGGRPRAAVRVHRARTLQPDDVQFVNGLPVTTPARTILDASVGASRHQVRRLIREAEFRRLIGVGAMADVVRRNPFHPGSRVIRTVDPQTAEARVTLTPVEDRMSQIVDRLSIGRLETQLPLTGRTGRSYRADFAWPDLRLIVEADGRSSHDRSTSFQSDRERDADLSAVGWLTLRFTSLQLADPDRVAATILATAETRPTHS